MFTSKIWTDDSRLLQELNLITRQPRSAPHHIIQATTSEGLAQGPYMAARVGFEPATNRTKVTESNTEPPCPLAAKMQFSMNARGSDISKEQNLQIQLPNST